MEKAVPVSIIIPTLNEEGYLPLLLSSLKIVRSPLDIIVVDGNSEDSTCRVAEEYMKDFPAPSSLRLIRSEKRGISLQRNLGASAAHHSILIFCDADVIMPSLEAHEQMIAEFVEKQYVAAAPPLIPIERAHSAVLAYKMVYAIQKLLLFLGRPYFAGSYLLTQRAVFEKIGGFDERILLAEDVDYSLRASKEGPSDLLTTPIFVSARRLIKYGMGWFLRDLPAIAKFMYTGKVDASRIFYPFGDFGIPKK